MRTEESVPLIMVVAVVVVLVMLVVLEMVGTSFGCALLMVPDTDVLPMKTKGDLLNRSSSSFCISNPCLSCHMLKRCC